MGFRSSFTILLHAAGIICQPLGAPIGMSAHSAQHCSELFRKLVSLTSSWFSGCATCRRLFVQMLCAPLRASPHALFSVGSWQGSLASQAIFEVSLLHLRHEMRMQGSQVHRCTD